MGEVMLRWGIALVGIAVIVGWIGTGMFVCVLNLFLPSRQDSQAPPWQGVPNWLSGPLTGIVERIFFAVVVATGLSGSAIAMVAWTALKGAVYWNAFGREFKAHVFVGLLGSLVSMLFAVLAGFVCNGTLWY
jgi:hypothetical protein